MPSFIFSSFARGEISPALHGRIDTNAYHTALSRARNMHIKASGGVQNRAGLKYLGPCKFHNRVSRVIDFKFKTTDTHVLELGHEYIRILRNDAHITENAKTITSVTQANPAVVTTSGSHGYANGDEVLITDVAGMLQLNGNRYIVANASGSTFELTSQVTGANVNSTSFDAYTSGGSVAKIYEIVSPYQESELFEINYTQSADVMTLLHPNHEPRQLSRNSLIDWALAEVSFSPDQAAPMGLTAVQNGSTGSTTYRYKVTAIGQDSLEESLAALNNSSLTITGATQSNPVVITTSGAHGLSSGEEVFIQDILGMTELNGRYFNITVTSATMFELDGEEGAGYNAYSSGGTAYLTYVEVTNGNATLSATNNITTSVNATANADRYAFYREDNGLYGWIGESENTSFVDDGKTPDLDIGPPKSREPFLGEDNRPRAVGYYQQRRVFGGTDNRPDTTFLTQTGNQSNMSVSTPTQPDDAITVSLTSQLVDEIRHYIPLNDLIVLTSGAEWRINFGDSNGLSAETIRQIPQTSWGSSTIRPVVIGSTIIYIQDNKTTMRTMGYSLQIDGYSGTDLTLLVDHLFLSRRFKDMAYARSPDPFVFSVTDDGAGACLTFSEEQEVFAWSLWSTPAVGKFESVTTIKPTVTSVDDLPYYTVKRRINGNTVRYVERLASRRFERVEDAFFVDSGLTYDNPIAISNVTLANPAVVTTSAAHGLSDGDEIDISEIVWVADVDALDNETQPAQMNGFRYTVRNPTATTLELEDDEGVAVDSLAFNDYLEEGEIRLAVSTFRGLDHLEGETLVALADGDVVTDLVVSGGAVTLPRKYGRVHIGLKYISEIETLNIATRAQSQTKQTIADMHKRVAGVTVRFYRSRGMWIGPSKTELTEMKQRELEKYGEPTGLLTGDKKVPLPSRWGTEGRVFIRQRDPLPLHIVAIIPDFEVES